jgi:hypothetical protein
MPERKKLIAFLFLTVALGCFFSIASFSISYKGLDCTTFDGGCTTNWGFPMVYYSVQEPGNLDPFSETVFVQRFHNNEINVIFWFLVAGILSYVTVFIFTPRFLVGSPKWNKKWERSPRLLSLTLICSVLLFLIVLLFTSVENCSQNCCSAVSGFPLSYNSPSNCGFSHETSSVWSEYAVLTIDFFFWILVVAVIAELIVLKPFKKKR